MITARMMVCQKMYMYQRRDFMGNLYLAENESNKSTCLMLLNLPLKGMIISSTELCSSGSTCMHFFSECIKPGLRVLSLFSSPRQSQDRVVTRIQTRVKVYCSVVYCKLLHFIMPSRIGYFCGRLNLVKVMQK